MNLSETTKFQLYAVLWGHKLLSELRQDKNHDAALSLAAFRSVDKLEVLTGFRFTQTHLGNWCR